MTTSKSCTLGRSGKTKDKSEITDLEGGELAGMAEERHRESFKRELGSKKGFRREREEGEQGRRKKKRKQDFAG